MTSGDCTGFAAWSKLLEFDLVVAGVPLPKLSSPSEKMDDWPLFKVSELSGALIDF